MSEDSSLHKDVERLPRHDFNESAHHVGGYGVFPGLTWLKVQRQSGQPLDERLKSIVIPPGHHALIVFDARAAVAVGESCRMGKQVANLHRSLRPK